MLNDITFLQQRLLSPRSSSSEIQDRVNSPIVTEPAQPASTVAQQATTTGLIFGTQTSPGGTNPFVNPEDRHDARSPSLGRRLSDLGAMANAVRREVTEAHGQVAYYRDLLAQRDRELAQVKTAPKPVI